MPRSTGLWISGLALSAGLAAPALADVVVLASTAPAIAPGQMIVSGTTIEVPEGAIVTLLSASGLSEEVVGPQSWSEAQALGAVNDGSILAALGGLLGQGGESASLGALRSLQPQSNCAKLVEQIGDSGEATPSLIAEMARKGCKNEAHAALEALMRNHINPALRIESDAAGYHLGSVIDLEMRSNVDGQVSCFYRQSDGVAVRFFPWSKDEGYIEAHKTARFAEIQDEVTLEVAEPVGQDQISCLLGVADLDAYPVGEPFDEARLDQLLEEAGRNSNMAASTLVIQVMPN